MSIIVLLLVSLIFFYASNTSFTFGLGYFSLYRPIVLASLLGLVTGHFSDCVVIGILVNMIFYDFASTGGSIRFDMSMITAASVLAISVFDCNALQAVGIAFPFGVVGTSIFMYRLNYNGKYVRELKGKILDDKENKKISFVSLIPQMKLFVVSVTSILATYIFLFIINKLISTDDLLRTRVLDFFELASLALLLNYFIYFIIKEFDFKYMLILLTVPLAFFLPKVLIAVAALITLYAVIKDMINMRKCKSNLILEDRKLSKNDLSKIWIKWMNLSHATFNTENMQAVALNSTFDNLYKKLYGSLREINERIIDNFDLFNVEPNIGTVAIGYQLHIEEEVADKTMDNEKSQAIKKSIMGMVSGIGDSFTQTALLPIFLGISICLMQTGLYLWAYLSIIAMCIMILVYSYCGIIYGYFYGKQGIMKYIEIIKNSQFQKIKKYVIITLFLLMYVLFIRYFLYDISDIANNNMFALIPIFLVSTLYNIIKRKNYNSVLNVVLLYVASVIILLVIAMI